MIVISMHRCTRHLKLCKTFFLIILVFSFIFLLSPLLYAIPRGTLWEKGKFLFTEEEERTALLMATGFVFFWSLLRKRFFWVDKAKGLVYYSLPCIGKRTYFMVEVRSIVMEVDMSEALVKLKHDNLHRVYLKLHNGKSLLITEETKERKAQEVASFLKEIFCVEIEQMQRIGWKRGVEINLGNYTIEKELSQGGMGKVFLALNKKNEQKVAIKILPASMSLNEKCVRNFVSEIQILEKLTHPGIVRFLDFGRDQGSYGDVYFYAMEFIEGRPLASFISEKELNPRQSAHIAMQIALALDYSHKNRIVHRDIKPSNIMIKSNHQAVLIDFGIARDTNAILPPLREYPDQTEVSHYVGTLPYMSPEQLSSNLNIDYRTDIYSLGVTLYEMLTFQKPFQGGNQSIYRSILAGYPYEPSSINPHIASDLDTIVMKAMEKNKYHRYQSGVAMAEDLSRWLKGEPILGKPVKYITRLWRKFRSIFKWI